MDSPEPGIVAEPGELDCNPTSNPLFSDVVTRRYGRRGVLQGGVALAVTTLVAGPAVAHDGRESNRGRGRERNLSFAAIPHTSADTVVVPEGYTVQVLIPEGDPIARDAAAYIPGDFNTGADREKQAGAHHDGMWFFPLFHGSSESEHGLLVVNHENINLELIHPDGGTFGTGRSRPNEDEVRKEIASHGVSVVEIRKNHQGEWKTVRGRYNRRFTAGSPMEIAGPVRGSTFVQTKYSPTGKKTRGTLNNCANGYTPWGTYLACEENWPRYFFATGTRTREQLRYGVPGSASASSYGWGTREEDQYIRFDASVKASVAAGDYRNETNCFGWVVEIDPFDPRSTPKKRTALGRLVREGATVAPAKQGRPLVVYMGDDGRGEYVFKFVSAKPYNKHTACGDELLDEGTLYVARFNDDGTGVWIALKHGVNGLTIANGWTSQAHILVDARTAADRVLATRMDRPEWITVDAQSGLVYMTLTNNSNRGVSSTQPLEPANPRRRNPDGHIIRWRERGDRQHATEFEWDIFAFGGATRETVLSLGAADTTYNGDEQYAVQVFPGTPEQRFLSEDASFNSPDGLWVAPSGILWIQTDGYSSAARGFGNQQMLAADPRSGEIKRFLTGPIGCELTGITSTPDGKTLFVNIQHPEGESTWPNINGETRPRSATLAITKDDGGVIGT